MKNVEDFYDDSVDYEWNRLNRHKIEFDITKRYLEKYINTGSKVLDIGGGPGRYSIYLTKKGNKVTLVDLSKKNVEMAKEKSQKENLNLEGYIHSNVLHLSENVDKKYDVVLCMGPLYHLIKKKNRIKAIKECLKILKKDGILIATFISAFAPIIDFIKNYPEEIVNYKKEFLINYIENGKNIVSEDNPGFTNAYFINPSEIEKFMDKFKMKKVIISGIEGIPAQSEKKLYKLSEKAYNEWIDLIFEISKDPSTWGSCEHMIYIGRKK